MLISVAHRTLGLSKPVLWHISCWGGYMVFELLSLRYFNGRLDPLYVYAYYYALNIAWFYAILANLGAPAGGGRFRQLKQLARWTGVVLGYLALKLFSAYLFYSHPALAAQLRQPLLFLVTNLYRGLYFAFLAVIYYVAGHLAEARRRETESRNAYLQQQLNPHLLFNTLNFIYGEVFKQAPKGAEAIELLAGILRYSLDGPGADNRVPVTLEIEQIENLVAINRFRYEERLALAVHLKGSFGDRTIIPLLLLTLTENIFKHGDLQDTGRPGLLSITLDEAGVLRYHSRNVKKPFAGRRTREPIGLKNIRVRLDYAYKDLYDLQIKDAPEYYELTLMIVL